MEEYLSQILEFCVTCGVNMMSLRHGWALGSPQTASPIHIRHIKSVWAHWYAFHWHTVAALNCYTHSTCLRFWGFGSLVESKWCQYVDSHLNLLLTSTWDTTKCLSTLICVILPLLSVCWLLCCWCRGVFTIVELAPCPGTVALFWCCCPSCQRAWPLNWRQGLLFYTRVGRLPLPLTSYLCKWPLNGREGPPSDGTSMHSPQQQAHQQDPQGCVGSKSPSEVLTELGNVGLSWQEVGWNRMWSSMHSMPLWLRALAMNVSKLLVQSMLYVIS